MFRTSLSSSFGDRSFSVADHTLWNSLPVSLRSFDNGLTTFKRLLKTYLFWWDQCAFVTFCLICALYKCSNLLTYKIPTVCSPLHWQVSQTSRDPGPSIELMTFPTQIFPPGGPYRTFSLISRTGLSKISNRNLKWTNPNAKRFWPGAFVLEDTPRDGGNIRTPLQLRAVQRVK